MADINEWHIGRSWGGPRHLEKEDELCEKAPCGLIAKAHPDCPEHHYTAMKTIRSSHRAEDCPGGA